MRNIFLALLIAFLVPLIAAGSAHARGGQGADDCPPGSADPDCKGK